MSKYQSLLLSLLIANVHCRNDDVFNYEFADKVENGPGSGVRSFGQPNWPDVTCDIRDTCSGFPNVYPHAHDPLFFTNDNNCRWCPESGPNDACGLHRQSPINLQRNVGAEGTPDYKDCPDWHWIHYNDDSCSWDDIKDHLSIERHALQVNIPQLPNGDIDCIQDGERRYPQVDYSKGFPDWFFMQHMEIMVPSQHAQEGHHYAAEVVLSHFYEISHHKNQLGNVAFFLQDYPDTKPWPYLDKLICQWRQIEENVRAKCGLPPAQPYGRCKLFRGQQPTQEWLLEQAGQLFSAQQQSPTPAPVLATTSTPTAVRNFGQQGNKTPTNVIRLQYPTWQAPFSAIAPMASPISVVTPSPVTPMAIPTDFVAPVTPPASFVAPTISPITKPVSQLPPLHNCNDRLLDYDRFCQSSDPCCESIRSDTEYCHDSYEKLGSAVESACYHCCDQPKLVGPKPPPKDNLPQTIKCSKIPNADRICRGCCQSPRSGAEFCQAEYNRYDDRTLQEICYYCCSVPSSVGPRRLLKSGRSSGQSSDAPSDVPSIGLSDSPSDVPSDAPTEMVQASSLEDFLAQLQYNTGPTPSVSPSFLVEAFAEQIPESKETSTIPPPIDCNDGKVPYSRMCDSIEPCCESTRSDTSFCWHSYDILGDAVSSACYHCCDKPKIVGLEAPTKKGLPKTITCSKIDNPHRICNGCCSNPRSTSDYCVDQYTKYGDNKMAQICHYCCSTPKELGPTSRALRIDSSIESDKKYIPEGAKVYHHKGKRYLMRKENFKPRGNEREDHDYYDLIRSAYKKRVLQDAATGAHLEDYLDVEYWPYEWFLKVGTEYYFRYEGTEVVPPCLETVHWRLFKDPIVVNKRQIDELSRLLAWRINPNTCLSDTAGTKSDGDSKIKANREIQYTHDQHRIVFCECKDWPSKFDADKLWCRNWESDTTYQRFYNRPYSFNYTDPRWTP